MPIYFAYHDGYLYSFSTVGRKIEWMRGNPLVCLETDEVVSSQPWWEPGYVKTIVDGIERPLMPVFYRIRILEITGHRATPNLESQGI